MNAQPERPIPAPVPAAGMGGTHRPKVNVHVAQTGECYACATDESLLKGMLRLGRKGIPVGCVNGGCGVCKVRVLEGSITSLGPVSRAHVTEAEQQQGFTLACRAAPTTPVSLRVVGKFEKPFSRGLATSAVAGTESKQQQPPSKETKPWV